MAVAYFIIRCISILLVFGFVVQCEEVGLGKHVLVNETIIELKNNTRIAENDTDLVQYRKLPGACDVTLDNDGNIILWYSKNSSTTEFGCSVDLVTTKKEQILLEFGISHSGNLSDCVTKKKNYVPDNMISFSYSMNGSEFEELKNGPKHGDVNDCSDKDKCNAGRGTCVKTTSFYSVGWVNTTMYFLLPVGDVRYYYRMKTKTITNASFELMIKGQEFRFASVDDHFFNLANMCYKKEKLLKAEKWEIDDINYINSSNNQNFTHLFTFNIMPIKAMRQVLQNILIDCKKNVSKPGCDKEATMLKCDKISIRFDKEHFKILVPDVPVAENGTSTDGNETLDVSTTQTPKIITTEEVDTTTDDVEVTRIPTATESSGMPKIIIVVIICSVVVLCLTSFVCVLICILFRGEKEGENQSEGTKYSQGTNIRSTQSTTNKPTKDSNVDVEMPSHVSGKEQKEEEKSFNDASTVVETQYQDFNDVNSVVATQMEQPEEASNLKTCIALPDTFPDTKTCIEVRHDNDFSVKSDKTVPDALISKNTAHEDLVVKEDPLIHNTQSDVEITDSVNE
uniref:F5/8 type C domain-containing protein n=1 Tax=Meloidogyne incognita TaxID=6306 RepID=A0A914MFM4_MELIC